MGPSSCATNDAYGLKFLDHQLDININILSRYRVEIDRSTYGSVDSYHADASYAISTRSISIANIILSLPVS